MRPREAPHYADHVVRPRLHAFKYNHTPSITVTLPNNAPTLFGFLDDISAGYPRWNIHQTAIGSGNAGTALSGMLGQPVDISVPAAAARSTQPLWVDLGEARRLLSFENEREVLDAAAGMLPGGATPPV